MGKDKDERMRSHLRLVVNNAEKRNLRPSGSEEEVIPFEELLAKRDILRPEFYRTLGRGQVKAYAAFERFLERKGWPYGLDPTHGRLMIIPVGVICADAFEHGVVPQEEVLLYVMDDMTGQGLCVSLETVLPFYSEDDAVMEEALLYSPVFQYGTLFLEENRQDGFLDLIYRLAFPLYPPALTGRIFDRFFAVAALELKETLQCLAEYPGP